MLDQRPRIHPRAAVLGDEGVIEKIPRHHVDAAFDASEAAADGPSESAQHRGLADADIAFQQHMAASKDGDQDQPDGRLLAYHDLGDVRFDVAGQFCRVLEKTILVHVRYLES